MRTERRRETKAATQTETQSESEGAMLWKQTVEILIAKGWSHAEAVEAANMVLITHQQRCRVEALQQRADAEPKSSRRFRRRL